MIRPAVFLRLLAVLMLCSACSVVYRGSRSVVAQPDDARIRYSGWFDRRTPRAVRFAWPGTHITALFTGTALTLDVTDTPIDDDTRETDWLTVIVDDQPPRALALAEARHQYPLATGLTSGPHRVVIWKRTEAEVGTITFHGFLIVGGTLLTPLPSATDRRLFFVGDSITAGYGNEGRDPSCHGSAARENNYGSYGADASRELGADYVAAAWSGKGVTRNYDPLDHLTLPDIYDRVIATEATSPRAPVQSVDVVVVNVGTNDFVQGVPDEKVFIDAYRRLLESLRVRNPRALFVLGLGPMVAGDYPQPEARATLRRWMEEVRDERRSTGDAKIEVLELWSDPAEGVGCGSHPNMVAHARFGRELAALVRTRLDW